MGVMMGCEYCVIRTELSVCKQTGHSFVIWMYYMNYVILHRSTLYHKRLILSVKLNAVADMKAHLKLGLYLEV